MSDSNKADDLALYHHEECPFCKKVRDVMNRLGLEMDLRDIRKDDNNRQELVNGGGQQKVPCLRIAKPDGSSEWMYESDDISQYLLERFDTSNETRH
jgi:glutathione S-transferase